MAQRTEPGDSPNDFPIPPDYQEKTEWAFARLMYPPVYGNRFGDWREGHSHWTMDYPRSDRHLSEAVRRLSRPAMSQYSSRSPPVGWPARGDPSQGGWCSQGGTR
jgi:hypothetical protein